MSATILVHLDGGPGAFEGVELAARLAERFDATLAGSAAGAPVAQTALRAAGVGTRGLWPAATAGLPRR